MLATVYKCGHISFQEKSQRNCQKRALVSLALEDTQSGVMDCLLEALKTGSAFSREGKRRRNSHQPLTEVSAVRRVQPDRTRSRARLPATGYLTVR